MRAYLSPDRLFAALCLVLVVALTVAISRLPDPTAFQQISAKIWPTVLAVALAIAAVVIWFDDPGPPELEDTAREDEPPGTSGLAIVAALVASAPIMEYFGYWIAGSFLMAVVFAVKEKRGHVLRSLLCAVLLPGAIYLLFTRVLSQYLPPGNILSWL